MKDKGLKTPFNSAILERKGVITHSGSIVDASFVEVPRQWNSRDENARINSGEIPEEWKPEKFHQKAAPI